MRLCWLFCFFLSSGCIYQSTITGYKAKKGSSLTISRDSLKAIGENTIFDSPIEMENLFSSSRASNVNNAVSGILINESNNNYIEWRQDSSMLYISLKRNKKTLVSNFYLTYDKTDFKNQQLEKIADRTYRLSFQTDSGNNNLTRRTNFTITKSANYLISSGLLEIWSGEIYNAAGIRFTFLVFNDPDDPIKVATDLCFLTVCDLDEYDDKCAEKCKSPRKGNVRAKQKWKWWGLFYDIVCEGCK
jgi:hypothetical protein